MRMQCVPNVYLMCIQCVPCHVGLIIDTVQAHAMLVRNGLENGYLLFQGLLVKLSRLLWQCRRQRMCQPDGQWLSNVVSLVRCTRFKLHVPKNTH